MNDKDTIIQGAINQSIVFALDLAELTVTEFRLSYTRWLTGDGTSFTTLTSNMTELATTTTIHTDNAGKYLNTGTQNGSQFLFRADVPDDAFFAGKDRVAISVYDDLDNEVAHREFLLTPTADLSGYVNGFVYLDADASNTGTLLGTDGTIKNPVSSLASAITLADQLGKKLFVKGFFNNVAGDLSNYTIDGNGLDSWLDGDTITGIILVDAHVTNVQLSGDIVFTNTTDTENCVIREIGDTVANAGLDGTHRNARFQGESKMRKGDSHVLIDCTGTSASASSSPAVLNFGASGTDITINISNFKGYLTLSSITDGDLVECYSSGATRLDASGTLGTIRLYGIGNFELTSGTTTVDDAEWTEIPIVGGGDLTSILGTPISETTAGNFAANMSIFYDNADAITSRVVDDVGGAGGSLTAQEVEDAVWNAARADHVANLSFGQYTNANLTNIEGAVTIDTIAITAMFENMIAALQGNVARSGNTYSYKKQNGTSEAFSYTVSGTGRVA